MPKRKLTAAAVEKLKPPKSGQEEHFDSSYPGLALRISYGGAKSWVFHYRLKGRQRRLTFGGYPEFSLQEAHDLWRDAKQKVREGSDPAIKEEEEAPKTIADLGGEFFKRYFRPRNRTSPEIERMFDQHVYPIIGKMQAEDVTQRDILRILDKVEEGGATVRANRVLAAVKRFFNWCIERGHLQASPAAHVKPPAKETPRDRVLTDEEIIALLAAIEEAGDPFGPIFHLLLLTGQRRTEVSDARWSEFDLSSGLWELPPERVKNGRTHRLPLSDAAAEIVAALPSKGNSDLLFPAQFRRVKDGQERAVSGFTRAKERIDEHMLAHMRKVAEKRGEDPEAVNIPKWTIHDLRRTAASGMARLGVPVHVVEKALNHVSGTVSGIAAVYNRHDYQDEVRSALNAWASYLDGLTNDRDSVVYLAEAKAER